MKSEFLMRFLPALCVWPVWMYIMTSSSAWSSSLTEYYPLCIAMIFGSLIAGSTPLGGGIVAFPVSVLIIEFTPSQGRDFSLLIQSVGMSCAAYLIFYSKHDLIARCGNLIGSSCVSGVLGLVAGSELAVSPFTVNILFTTMVACFAVVLGYMEWAGDVSPNGAAPTERRKGEMSWPLRFGLVVQGFFGGMLSSQIGSGSDVAWFMYASLFLNKSRGKEDRIDDNALTACSVIIMAAISVFGSAIRLAQGVESDVFLALLACVWVVCLGAPLGSLFLTPRRRSLLKRAFYVLALVQLLTFGIIKIKGNAAAWFGVGGALVFVLVVIASHYFFVLKKKGDGASFSNQKNLPVAAL